MEKKLIQIAVEKKDRDLIRDFAKDRGLPMSTFCRLVLLEFMKNQLGEEKT